MKSEHSAYVTLLERITTLNKGWRPPRWRDKREAKKEEGRKGSIKKGRNGVPALSRRPGRIDGARLRVLEDRIRPSIHIYTRPRARIKTRAACRLPVPGRPMQPGALSSAQGSLGSFYEHSLWKRASWARDKLAVYLYLSTKYVCKCACSHKTHGARAYKNTYIRRHIRNSENTFPYIADACEISNADIRADIYRRVRTRVKLHPATGAPHMCDEFTCVWHAARCCPKPRRLDARSRQTMARAKNFCLLLHENVDWSIIVSDMWRWNVFVKYIM